MDWIIRLIKPDDRRAMLNSTRNLKMARSAHAYVRGSTEKFYKWLGTSHDNVPSGPPVWICGDCHLGNLGPLADAKGHVSVQIRDLDQTVIGNPAHDLIRLALSLASSARGFDLPGVTTALILARITEGYEGAFASDDDRKIEKDRRPGSIQKLVQHALRRRWQHLALERLDTVKPRIPLGKKFWTLSTTEHSGLAELFDQEAVRAMLTSLQERDSDAPVELIDAAYWMKGCSSLGRLRYAAMLRVGKGKDAAICLVDVKEAVTAAAPRAPGGVMPRDNAARVVKGAQALSPNLGGRMIAARLLGTSVVLRELMPQDLKIEIDRLSSDKATELAYYLGGVVGLAHSRQMDDGVRSDWLATLQKSKPAKAEVPSWLWSSVVDLLAIHEVAYLDHCRRYAFAAAA
jgi:uncharacterized protein (DUF2252 family)